MRYILTTTPGLEDVCLWEIKKRIPGARELEPPGERRGRVLVEIPEKMEKELFRLHTVHHIARFLDSFGLSGTLEDLEEIRNRVPEIVVPAVDKEPESFRITTERVGTHPYNSMDVQREAGAGVVGATGWRVDLENHELEVMVDVVFDECIVGIKLTREALSKNRFSRVFDHPAALNPVIAHGMLYLSGALEKNAGRLLDPMCGGGTIPIEAALVLPEGWEIVAMDIHPGYVAGAIKNSKSAGVFDRIVFKRGDATRLEQKFGSESFDIVLANPPYGVRFGDSWNVSWLYPRLCSSVYRVLEPGGVFVTITSKVVRMRSALERAGFEIGHERVVDHGGLLPRIFVARKSHKPRKP